VSGGSVVFTIAPLSGVVVTIKRITNKATQAVMFHDASVLTAPDLAANSTQLFNLLQEQDDVAGNALGKSYDGLFDAGGVRIKNVAAPVKPQDAVTKSYADSTIPVSVAAAASSATSASSSEAAAAASALASAISAAQSQTMPSAYITGINSGQIGGFRNKIINGDMQVAQVNGGTAVTPAVAITYPLDQWQYIPSQASKLTLQQVADAPAGFKYSTKITVAAQYAPLATDYFGYVQPIEGQNIVDFQLGSAGAVTLATSNYIKGSVAGVYSVYIKNGANNRSYVGTINVTTAWARVVITLVGDTSGVWATDKTVGLQWGIDLGSGTNFNTAANAWQAGNFQRTSGSVSFVNQVAGSTLNITGVQLEKVSAGATQGTEFEHAKPDDQLRWCQRYLPCWGYVDGANLGTGVFVATTVAYSTLVFPVPTRVPVTGVICSATSHMQANNSGGFVGSGTISLNMTGSKSALIGFLVAGATAGTSYYLYFNNAAGQLYFTGCQL